MNLWKNLRSLFILDKLKFWIKISRWIIDDLPKGSEAYIFGSLANGKFGKYSECYNGHLGSDIDVMVFLNGANKPSTWKSLDVSKTWWDLYSGIEIKINNNTNNSNETNSQEKIITKIMTIL